MMTLTPTRPAAATPQRPALLRRDGDPEIRLLPPRSRRPSRRRDRARRRLPRLVRPGFRWCRRLPGAVGLLLRRSLLRTALNPESSLSPGRRSSGWCAGCCPHWSWCLPPSAVLTILVQPETRWETFADQSLASLGYYQNWELANTASNYLRAGEAVSPLQHIWSMSVQGQFYIASWCSSSLLAYALRQPLGSTLRVTFVTLLTALTIGVVRLCHHSRTRPTRPRRTTTASPGPGSCCSARWSARWCPTSRWPMWLRTVLADRRLAAILSCGALIDGVRQFPGPWALVPVGATVLMILAAANRQADPPPATGCRCPTGCWPPRPS